MEEQGDLGNRKVCEWKLIYPSVLHGSTNKHEWIKNIQPSSLPWLNPSLCRDASCRVTPAGTGWGEETAPNLVQPFACQSLPVQLLYFWVDAGYLPLERLIKLGCLIYQISAFIFPRRDPKCFNKKAFCIMYCYRNDKSPKNREEQQENI